jgi:hypothetical protein
MQEAMRSRPLPVAILWGMRVRHDLTISSVHGPKKKRARVSRSRLGGSPLAPRGGLPWEWVFIEAAIQEVQLLVTVCIRTPAYWWVDGKAYPVPNPRPILAQ